MIGIIVAVEEELSTVIELLQNKEEILSESDLFYRGVIENKEVVVSRAGVGKVNCAYLTTKMALLFKPHLIINIGVAGALSKQLKVLDTVVATCSAQHDMYVAGWPKGLENDRTLVKVDKQLIKNLREINFTYPLVFGPIVSGDTFVEAKHISTILEFYPLALAVEMEGAAMALVCERLALKWLVIRSISDITTNKNNALSYDQFVKQASLRATTFLKEFLRSYHE